MMRLALLSLTVSAAGCGGGSMAASYPRPQAADVVTHIKDVRQRASSLRADTKADVWLGNQRARVTLNILAEWGGKIRFQAENPNNSTAADLGSDGHTYCFLDANHDCGECGRATPASVGRLIGLELEPDQIVAVLLGSTPVLEGDATTRWESGSGREVVEITAAGGARQKIQLDGRDKRWDVLESEVWGADGKRVYKVRHADFHDVARADGTKVRLPGKSQFEQKEQDAIVDWRKQELDLAIPAASFSLNLPAGLQGCH